MWVTYLVTRVPTTEGSEPEATQTTKLYLRSRLHYMVGLGMGGRNLNRDKHKGFRRNAQKDCPMTVY